MMGWVMPKNPTQPSSAHSPEQSPWADWRAVSFGKKGLVSIPSKPKGTTPCPTQCPAGGGHPLFLAGHKGLEAWGHAEAQLVDVGWLLLAVDLHSDASLKRRLVCTVEMGSLKKPSQAGSPRQSPQVGPVPSPPTYLSLSRWAGTPPAGCPA